MSAENVSNPFDGPEEARRYREGRPAFHALVLGRLVPELRGRSLGLDVACGTGLSSVALAELVERVLAYDTSAAMLAQAAPHPRVEYAQAPAEALPVGSGVADIRRWLGTELSPFFTHEAARPLLFRAWGAALTRLP